MNGKTHPFEEEELLAYIQGQADPDLASRIDQARRNLPDLDAELTLMTNLKPALGKMASELNPPGEFGWRRLEADIRRETRSSAPGTLASGRIWKIAAAVLMVVAIGQAAWIARDFSSPPAGYRTVSDAATPHVFAVKFVPSATEQDIRTLLQRVGARLIDGPGASGIYRIAFSSADEREAQRETVETAPIIELLLEE